MKPSQSSRPRYRMMAANVEGGILASLTNIKTTAATATKKGASSSTFKPDSTPSKTIQPSTSSQNSGPNATTKRSVFSRRTHLPAATQSSNSNSNDSQSTPTSPLIITGTKTRSPSCCNGSGKWAGGSSATTASPSPPPPVQTLIITTSSPLPPKQQWQQERPQRASSRRLVKVSHRALPLMRRNRAMNNMERECSHHSRMSLGSQSSSSPPEASYSGPPSPSSSTTSNSPTTEKSSPGSVHSSMRSFESSSSTPLSSLCDSSFNHKQMLKHSPTPSSSSSNIARGLIHSHQYACNRSDDGDKTASSIAEPSLDDDDDEDPGSFDNDDDISSPLEDDQDSSHDLSSYHPSASNGNENADDDDDDDDDLNISSLVNDLDGDSTDRNYQRKSKVPVRKKPNSRVVKEAKNNNKCARGSPNFAVDDPHDNNDEQQQDDETDESVEEDAVIAVVVADDDYMASSSSTSANSNVEDDDDSFDEHGVVVNDDEAEKDCLDRSSLLHESQLSVFAFDDDDDGDKTLGKENELVTNHDAVSNEQTTAKQIHEPNIQRPDEDDDDVTQSIFDESQASILVFEDDDDNATDCDEKQHSKDLSMRTMSPEVELKVMVGNVDNIDADRVGMSRQKATVQGGDVKPEPQHKIRREGSVRQGQWRLGTKIGSGSFGVVHVGLNMDTGTLMAVKTVRTDQAVMKDIRREIGLLKSLAHPNIVRYLGAETSKSRLHIFQEWVPGGSITDLLRRFGPFSVPVVCNYLKQTLEGLAYLHDHNIMHRDIKGSNILVNDQGMVKLADFGASRKLQQLQGDLMLSLTMRGTPYFMAPEVFEEKYCRKADVWSVGCVAIQMATGQPPWKYLGFTNPVALFQHVKGCTDPPFSGVLAEDNRDHADPELQQFKTTITKCFERNPSQRPSATDLLKDSFFLERLPSLEEHDDATYGIFSPACSLWEGMSPLTRQLSPIAPPSSTKRRLLGGPPLRSPLFRSPPLSHHCYHHQAGGQNGNSHHDGDESPRVETLLASSQHDKSDWPSWARRDKVDPKEVAAAGTASNSPTRQMMIIMDSLAISSSSEETLAVQHSSQPRPVLSTRIHPVVCVETSKKKKKKKKQPSTSSTSSILSSSGRQTNASTPSLYGMNFVSGSSSSSMGEC